MLSGRFLPGKNEKHLLCLLRPDFRGMSESLQQIANIAQWHAERIKKEKKKEMLFT